MHKLFNMRYRFYTVNGKHYLVDMDERYWVMFFPLIYWFLPHTVYEVDEATFDKLKFDPEEVGEKTEVNIDYLAVGGISLLISNLLGYFSNFFEIGTAKSTNIIIIIIAGLIILGFRIYMSIKSRSKIKTNMNLDALPKASIFIIPTSIKYILTTILFFLMFLICSIILCYAFIMDNNTVYLIMFTISLLAYFISGALMITLEDFKVKFRYHN